jgi:hypothetical protein
MEWISLAACLVAFLALYAVLHVRANRGEQRYPVRWGWIAAIIGCALVVAIIGALS